MFSGFETDSLVEKIHRAGAEHPPNVGPVEFYVRAKRLEKIIRDMNAPPFHALLAIKRSGWVLGVILSHALGLPVFAKVEVDNIPPKLTRILIVDTSSWTGRSIRRAFSTLESHAHAECTAAVLMIKRGLVFPPEMNVVAESECDGIPRFFFHPDFKYEFCSDRDWIGEAAGFDGANYPEYPKPPRS